MRVVLDTNIFVSAVLKADSLPFLVVRWIDQHAGLLKSPATEHEILDVLGRPHIAAVTTPSFGENLATLLARAEMITILERILAPRRERAVRFALPPIESAADIAGAMGAVAAAVAEGALTPGEAGALAQIVDTFVRAIETSDFDRRLQALEANAARP